MSKSKSSKKTKSKGKSSQKKVEPDQFDKVSLYTQPGLYLKTLGEVIADLFHKTTKFVVEKVKLLGFICVVGLIFA